MPSTEPRGGAIVSEVTIAQLLEQTSELLGLAWLAGREGADRVIAVPRIQKPGLALAGYDEQLHRDRLLTLGGTEIEYLRGAEPERRRLGIDTMMAANPACIVVTRGLEPPAELVVACDAGRVPLLLSKLVSADFIARITHYLQDKLSPKTTVHGVLIDVLGVGILVIGKSGIGKSEVALDLVARGHRLVADDVVDIRRIGPSELHGWGSGLVRYHMEIRGLGIIDIRELFGVSAVREEKLIELVIELREWDEADEYDRLGVDDAIHPILGEELPFLRIPVRPGRSVSTIIEVAARNHLFKETGRHSARELAERLSTRLGSEAGRYR